MAGSVASWCGASPLLIWERELWSSGIGDIAGVDEVGRGALAGPLVAAAVVLPADIRDDTSRDDFWLAVRDSKTLTSAQRLLLATGIRSRAKHVSVAAVDSTEIDLIGVGPANRAAMERAVLALAIEPDCLLIDALTVDLGVQQIGIIDGDALSLSIAAASIVAKDHRDRLMIAMASDFPAYHFDANKGYGVARHLLALETEGPCVHHRTCFAPVRRAIEYRRARR